MEEKVFVLVNGKKKFELPIPNDLPAKDLRKYVRQQVGVKEGDIYTEDLIVNLLIIES